VLDASARTGCLIGKAAAGEMSGMLNAVAARRVLKPLRLPCVCCAWFFEACEYFFRSRCRWLLPITAQTSKNQANGVFFEKV